MFNYVYQTQQESSWCGAACLSMVFHYFGIPKKQKDIMEEIQKGDVTKDFLLVHQIPNYVELKGLQSCGIKAIGAKSFIDWCLSNRIALIMSHKERNSQNAHYTLLEKRVDNIVYSIDPYKKENFPITVDELIELWRENWQLNYGGVAGNTGVLIYNNPKLSYRDNCIHCKEEFNGIRIPASISTNVICPHCNKWNKIKFTG